MVTNLLKRSAVVLSLVLGISASAAPAVPHTGVVMPPCIPGQPCQRVVMPPCIPGQPCQRVVMPPCIPGQPCQ
jgi:hypothetical protein